MLMDKRYSLRRWKDVRLRVLNRDLWTCQVVVGCEVGATVADHIYPVYAGMPDSEFFDMANLRASCKRHNTARGVAARLQREMGGVDALVAPRRLSVGQGGFFGGAPVLHVGSPGTELEFAL